MKTNYAKAAIVIYSIIGCAYPAGRTRWLTLMTADGQPVHLTCRSQSLQAAMRWSICDIVQDPYYDPWNLMLCIQSGLVIDYTWPQLSCDLADFEIGVLGHDAAMAYYL